MSISWDENQITSVANFLQEKLPLTQGKVVVCMGDVPDRCFAGSVNIDEKQFILLTGIDMTLYEMVINIVLAYSIALAYEESEWTALPPMESLFDSHRKVCEIMMELNEELAVAFEDYIDIVETWHSAQGEEYGGEGDLEEVLDELGGLLFSDPDNSNKDYGSN